RPRKRKKTIEHPIHKNQGPIQHPGQNHPPLKKAHEPGNKKKKKQQKKTNKQPHQTKTGQQKAQYNLGDPPTNPPPQ
ncbi:hypothetical protein, partial [Stenotrophomonas maltophilia]|uniref:hypothetical protein n=1 Tax=Stenotrophomonas maltophilia TaxID=40324 RepID=UPI0034E1FCFF